MTYKQELRKKVDAVPREKRQEVLDLTWSSLSVGEICNKLNLDTSIVAQIVVDNIETTKHLRREAK